MTHPQNKEILEKFDNMHARCIGGDGEYTDQEIILLLSDAVKRIVADDKKFILSILESKDQEKEKALENYKKGLRGKIEKKNPDKDEMFSFRLGYRVAKSKILILIK